MDGSVRKEFLIDFRKRRGSPEVDALGTHRLYKRVGPWGNLQLFEYQRRRDTLLTHLVSVP